MIGRVTVVQDDKTAVFVQFDRPGVFKMGDEVNVSKQRKQRSLQQNRLYWAFLTWLIHPAGGDLRSQGHFSTDALHQDIKAWIESEHQHDFPIDKKFSTTELTTQQFNEFLDLVSQELFTEFLGVDVSGFWVEYGKFSRWSEYNEPDMKTYMDEIPF